MKFEDLGLEENFILNSEIDAELKSVQMFTKRTFIEIIVKVGTDERKVPINAYSASCPSLGRCFESSEEVIKVV